MDPFVLLLGCRGRDTVHHVVSFHYSPISLRLTRLNELTTVVGDVQLKAVLEKQTVYIGILKFRYMIIIFAFDFEEKCKLTGFLGSSTSRMLRFSKGMIPRGSLSC